MGIKFNPSMSHMSIATHRDGTRPEAKASGLFRTVKLLKADTMKNTFATAALVLATSLIASTAFAADAGALTREQVRASVLQARADGSLNLVNEGAKRSVITSSNVTRDAVVAEYQAAKKAGTLYSANEPGEQFVAPAASVRSRADVRAEAVVAAHNHTQEFGG
jgi:hypothetical protein